VQYLVRFDVKQPENMTNADLVAMWQREAEAVAAAREAGAVKHLWKVAGQRVIVGIVEFDSHEDVDRALGSLPIFREMGAGVVTEVLPIYDYATFAQDLNTGAHGPGSHAGRAVLHGRAPAGGGLRLHGRPGEPPGVADLEGGGRAADGRRAAPRLSHP